MALSIPNTFTPETVALSAEVNENFQAVADQAVAKSGDTMTKALTGTAITLSGAMTALTGAITSTSATALDVAGGITAGTGNVAIVDTTGKIPAISSTYFASLDGSALTGTGGEAENNVIAVQVFS
jgi:hypothetical protein